MISLEMGSFKDPEGRVFYRDNEVFRSLSDVAADRICRLVKQGILEDLVANNLVVPTKFLPACEAGFDTNEFGAHVLKHDRIPFFVYPYEFSFDMLKDAGLLTLELLETCLDHDLILKDGTAFNTTFREGRMAFVDVLSIDDYNPTQPWNGYGQFCREYLFPLMLSGYKRIDFQSILRGTLSGVSPTDMSSLLSLRDMLRAGGIKHVLLQGVIERLQQKTVPKANAGKAGLSFPKQAIVANVRGLRRLLNKMSYKPRWTPWQSYTDHSSYSQEEIEGKSTFIKIGLSMLAANHVVDIGANTGTYSLLAADQAELVVAIDSDAAAVNNLYLHCRDCGIRNVVPIVADLMNPSPSLGWELTERASLFERLDSDSFMFMALAIVHHICITNNVPIERFVQQLAAISDKGIVEWVEKEDEMVQVLLKNRKDIFSEYSWENFKKSLERHFAIKKVLDIKNGKRRLCVVGPRVG